MGALEAEMEKLGNKGNKNYYNKPLDFAHIAIYLKVYFILLIINIKNVKYLAEKGNKKTFSNTFLSQSRCFLYVHILSNFF